MMPKRKRNPLKKEERKEEKKKKKKKKATTKRDLNGGTGGENEGDTMHLLICRISEGVKRKEEFWAVWWGGCHHDQV